MQVLKSDNNLNSLLCACSVVNGGYILFLFLKVRLLEGKQKQNKKQIKQRKQTREKKL